MTACYTAQSIGKVDGMGRVNTTKARRKTTKRTARASAPVPPGSVSPSPDKPSGSRSATQPQGIISPWGRVDEEYALIKADLTRLLWVTALLLALLLLLTIVLR